MGRRVRRIEADGRPVGRMRRSAQWSVRRSTDAARSTLDNHPTAAKVAGGATTAAKAVTTKAKQGSQWVGRSVVEAGHKLSLDDYRLAVDTALDEALLVIQAQQAEIGALRQRLDDLERRARR